MDAPRDLSRRPKVLLLNPPGARRYVRDYYCSKISKSGYLYTPVDFLYAGAWLDHSFELSFLDCILDGVSDLRLLEMLAEDTPEVIVALTGYVSWREDFALFREIKRRFPGTRLVGSGDILLEPDHTLLLEASGLDALLLDFSSPEIVEVCAGDEGPFVAVATRAEPVPMPRESGRERLHLPPPPQRLFPLARYRYPFVRREPFATVLTDFSCPYGCSFCVMSGLPYRSRPAADVLAELRDLKTAGVREIYFADQTFFAAGRDTEELLEGMVAEGFGFGWVCFSRADVVTPERLDLMKRAGCHTIIFGVEFGSDALLAATGKRMRVSRVEEALQDCRRAGIRTVGTFLLGEPSQTEADLDAIADLAMALPLDFASFNLFVPRSGRLFETLRDEADGGSVDQSGYVARSFAPAIPTDVLARHLKAAIRRFYMRPRYILKRLFGVTSAYEARLLFEEGYALMREAMRR